MHILISRCYISPAAPQPQPQAQDQEELAALQHRARRKLLMLLASFTAAITYVSGLSPSNGYWNSVESNNDRIMVFLYLNAIPFTASLWIVVLLLSNNSWMSALVLRPLWRWRTQPIKISAVIASILPHVLLLGMLGANIAGTYPMVKKMVVYQFGLLFMGITTWIFLVTCNKPCSTTAAGDEQGEPVFELGSDTITRNNEESRKVRSLILLLATLAATVTYQAGLHPPGGVWQEDGQTHRAGYPILLSTQSSRYKVFIYFNSVGFLLSVAAISMLTFNNRKVHTTLLVSMILDMVALTGAYTVGSWRDVRSSIYVVAMACSVIIYMMIHLLCVMKTTATMEMEGTRLMKKRHKRLLMVAILVATTTYQAGLNPPGSFRVHGDDSHAAGTVLLMDSYPRRLRAFLYCNTVSFMSTLALIIFFTSPNLYRRAVRCYPIYGCIVLALLCLMAAYTAGTAKRVQTYAYVFVLLAMVVSAIGIHIIKSRAFLLRKEEEVVEDEHRSGAVFGHVHHIPRSRPRPRHIPRARLRLRSAQETKYRQEYTSHKHSVLLGILAAGATYQAGFNPPGGLWQDNGNPVLYDSDKKMYLAFFYCNYTSFMASIFVVTLHLLQEHIVQSVRYLMVIQMSTKITLVIDLLCLVAAYGAGVAKAELFT